MGNGDGLSIKAVFVAIGLALLLGVIIEANTPKCIERGCNNKQEEGSSYCILHKPRFKHSANKSTTSTQSKTTTEDSTTSERSNVSGTSSYKKSKRKSSYRSYDDGYEAIYDDDDYDEDRYERDSGYADGVDDAMDELDW